MATSKKTSTSAAPRLKLVIRRLPPNLPEELFWKAVAPWVTDETCTWRRFVRGRPAVNPNDHPMHSRAYCSMANIENLVDFHRHFDGHVFRSRSGVEHQAVVEFAPVQKVPAKAKVKTDARQGTIDDDADFKSFMHSLTAPAEPAKLVDVAPPPPKVESTPLLDHLRLHGSKSSKRKNRSDTSTTDLARSAASAINAAASKRTSKDTGPVLQAGKGRETVSVPLSAAPTGKAKGKGKSAAKDKKEETAGDVPVPKAKGDRSGKGKGKKDQPARPTESASQSATQTSNNPSRPVKTTAPNPPSTGRTTPTTVNTGQIQLPTAPKSPNRGEKSARAQGAGRGGRGGKSLADRARTQVAEVLAKNAEAATRESSKGRGRGRGKGASGESTDNANVPPMQPKLLTRTNAPDPRNARIDG